ncbi:MAG TPA: 4-hydroxy-3-methylbut-2-enyl diphosphate reductase [Planctomycetota bacterium]|nr:4-hydroxy-3-methylbut-2-enyl diphosphate reductase [Planctomycetota bacterium]
MIVLRAAELGMCFGVRDALAVLEQLPDPRQVTVHGELVHNGEVLRELDRRGFHRASEDHRAVPDTPSVLITAHGVSDRERARLQAAGKQLIDTTCPLVDKAHRAAQSLAADGRRVVVLGKRDHVEVRGIVGDLEAPIVVEHERDVACWPEPRLGVVCQTTTQVEVADGLLAAIRAANPHADVLFVDTICSPTKARIRAVELLLQRVDGLVVVGGSNSNNTRQLVARAVAAGVPALHVQDAADLDHDWLRRRTVVGLTAGTSTPARTIDAVEQALRAFAGRLDGPRAA